MNIIQLIDMIQKRPAMYLNRNSIMCLRSFLDGWYFRNIEEDVKMEILNQFTNWLQEKYKLNDNFQWDKIILFYSQDDAEALNNFFNQFNVFKQELTKKI